MTLDNSKALLSHIDKELQTSLQQIKKMHDQELNTFSERQAAQFDLAKKNAKNQYRKDKDQVQQQMQSSLYLSRKQLLLKKQNMLLQEAIIQIKNSLTSQEKKTITQMMLSSLDYPKRAQVHVMKGVKITGTNDDLNNLSVQVDLDKDRSLEKSFEDLLQENQGLLMKYIKELISWKHSS